jgi:hypothetical protein
MESLKGHPYRLPWQGLLGCELLAVPAVFKLLVLLLYICRPMSSLLLYLNVLENSFHTEACTVKKRVISGD